MSMLSGAPWLLAHKSMLSVNKPIKVSLYARDYVIWKDSRDGVQALPNSCPHMGAMLSEGWCEVRTDGTSEIVCPFHALAFDCKGRTVLPGSQKKTLPQLAPLPLIVQGDFIWSYGDAEPKMEIPSILASIAAEYEFVGVTGDVSVETPLLPMLLNMHDYNHQNGTHREMFRIDSVHVETFRDQGHYSEAVVKMPKSKPTRREIFQNPAVMLLPDVIEAHFDNHFPSLVVFKGESVAGPIAQCHLFIPESASRTRTYALVFAKLKSPLFRVMKSSVLKLVNTVIEQDADILTKLYVDQPQNIKLNNEVGMDWVRRNYENWPSVCEPAHMRAI